MRRYITAEEFDLMTESEIDAWEEEKRLYEQSQVRYPSGSRGSSAKALFVGSNPTLTSEKKYIMKPNYQSIQLDSKTNYEPVSDISLNLGDLIILHNACVDILNQYPEMVGYNNTRNKLKKIIERHRNQNN